MAPKEKIATPDWLKKANFYQIYPRVHKCRDKDNDGQIGAGDFSTLVDIKADLPRIKALNINAIWLMPIHPIGEINRKGAYGSPYAAKDYLGIDRNLIEATEGECVKTTVKIQPCAYCAGLFLCLAFLPLNLFGLLSSQPTL